MAQSRGELIAVTELAPLAAAMDVVDRRAEVNHRYRKLITESRQVLAGESIRTSQARGVAKKLIVLVRAAGPALRAGLSEDERAALDAGLARAEQLAYRGDPA